MSRSGYTEDCDGAELELWRQTVENAIKGKRGQAFLRELLTSLDAMEPKRLVSEVLISEEGEVCAIGSVAKRKGIAMDGLDPYDRRQIGKIFNIAPALAAEIAWENDDGNWGKRETPEQRFNRVRRWVVENLKAAAPTPPAASDSSSTPQSK